MALLYLRKGETFAEMEKGFGDPFPRSDIRPRFYPAAAVHAPKMASVRIDTTHIISGLFYLYPQVSGLSKCDEMSGAVAFLRHK